MKRLLRKGMKDMEVEVAEWNWVCSAVWGGGWCNGTTLFYAPCSMFPQHGWNMHENQKEGLQGQGAAMNSLCFSDKETLTVSMRRHLRTQFELISKNSAWTAYSTKTTSHRQVYEAILLIDVVLFEAPLQTQWRIQSLFLKLLLLQLKIRSIKVLM